MSTGLKKVVLTRCYFLPQNQFMTHHKSSLSCRNNKTDIEKKFSQDQRKVILFLLSGGFK